MNGRVVDPSGAPVAGASLQPATAGRLVPRERPVRAGGASRLPAPPGEFELAAAAEGFSIARARVHLPRTPPRARAHAPAGRLLGGGDRRRDAARGQRRDAWSACPGSVDVLDPRQLEIVPRAERQRGAAQGDRRQRPRRGGPRPAAQHRDPRPQPDPLVEDCCCSRTACFVTYAPYGDNATYYHPPDRALRRRRGPQGVGPDRPTARSRSAASSTTSRPRPPREADRRRCAWPPATAATRSLQALGGGTWGGTAVLARVHAQAGRRRARQRPLAASTT